MGKNKPLASATGEGSGHAVRSTDAVRGKINHKELQSVFTEYVRELESSGVDSDIAEDEAAAATMEDFDLTEDDLDDAAVTILKLWADGQPPPRPGAERWETRPSDGGTFIVFRKSGVRTRDVALVDREDDARLIATAPDLLELARILVEHFGDGELIADGWSFRFRAMARACIAKAEGASTARSRTETGATLQPNLKEKPDDV
jgi:hypothetical protein